MRSFLQRISSRKFLLMLAAFLGSLGTSIAGLVIAEPVITTVGIICSTVSAALYAAIEAGVDAERGDKDE